jgi:hypothetical protein
MSEDCHDSNNVTLDEDGIEKHNLEPDPLDEIENEYQREFGS